MSYIVNFWYPNIRPEKKSSETTLFLGLTGEEAAHQVTKILDHPPKTYDFGKKLKEIFSSGKYLILLEKLKTLSHTARAV